MIVFKKFGKTIKIRNDHWERLKARYNPENAVLDDEWYDIKRSCPFCGYYLADDCVGCPFEVFGTHGCFDFFERIFPKEEKIEWGSIPVVSWEKDDDKEARKQLAKLQRIMDKIEASQ